MIKNPVTEFPCWKCGSMMKRIPHISKTTSEDGQTITGHNIEAFYPNWLFCPECSERGIEPKVFNDPIPEGDIA
jgi:hypothetical protein